jgi:hypothetical protein
MAQTAAEACRGGGKGTCREMDRYPGLPSGLTRRAPGDHPGLSDPRWPRTPGGVSPDARALTAPRTDRRPVGRPLVVGGMTEPAIAEPGPRVDLAVFTQSSQTLGAGLHETLEALLGTTTTTNTFPSDDLAHVCTPSCADRGTYHRPVAGSDRVRVPGQSQQRRNAYSAGTRSSMSCSARDQAFMTTLPTTLSCRSR